jgi:cysteinyl-tRNA synthetase
VTLSLFDTASRTQREFEPLDPADPSDPNKRRKVGIYVCGATVQSSPHIGHLRPAIVFDVLRRWLTRTGYDVTLIRNITDIDDKILTKSAEAGVPWWAHAAVIEREFTDAYNALGVLPVTFEPRATAHIPQMIEMTARLIERGHAYVTSPGNVWFDVESWATYGELTRQESGVLSTQDDAAARADVGSAAQAEARAQRPASAVLTPERRPTPHDGAAGKRGPRDFALFKAPKPGEPETASWQTPWGRARPGWHLECSAMAHRYLGEAFDIHGGGLDLRFPHHENEQAQSRAAGYGFARTWMHSAWITQSGEKMSKSLGNGLLASEVLAQAHPAAVRLAIVSAHYSSMLEWTPDTLAEATATWERISAFVKRAVDAAGEPADAADLPEAFVAAMDDDLCISVALAVVHDHVRQGNSALDGGDGEAAAAALVAVRGMLDVLGLDPLDPQWAATGASSSAMDALDTLIDAQLGARAQARANKDWAASDAIRDLLEAAGIDVKDSRDGATWSLRVG